MTPANLHWVSTITLLLDMVLLLGRLETLRRHMNEPRAKSYRRRLRVRRHVERRLAVLFSLTTFAAMLLGCALWIASGWPSGSSVPMIAALRCSFFATLDDEAFIARIVDRLHAVLPRLRLGTLADVGLVADLSIELRPGVNTMDLQIALARHSSTSQWSGVAHVIESMAVYVNARSLHLSALPDEALRARIDGALADVASAEGERWDMAIPLYTLRSTLFGRCQGNATPITAAVR